MTEEGSPRDPADETARISPALRWGLLGVLAAVFVGCVALSVILATNRSVPALGIEGEQAALQDQRDEVRAQAEQFMLRVNTYDPSMLADDGTMPEYRELITEVITPKFAAEFEQVVELPERLVRDQQLTVSCQVFSTAVSAIDQDSATALVAGATTSTLPAAEEGGEPQVLSQPVQLQVELRKIDGTWLVDDFGPVLRDGEAPAEPSPSPSASPTEGASP